MAYLAHTIHPQFAGLFVGSVGWILTMVTIGLIQWRVWVVDDASVISSGLAWVGIWRVCFYSHVVVTSERGVMYCQKMGISDSFVPMEITVAQVLMLVALALGLLANASTLYGLRNVFFGWDKHEPIRLAFTVGGLLHLLSSLCSLVPLCLNLRAVLTNQNISFPGNFYMPPTPTQQYVGEAIGVGITAAVLTVTSGALFLCYRFPIRTPSRVQPAWAGAGCSDGTDNPAYQSQENVE